MLLLLPTITSIVYSFLHLPHFLFLTLSPLLPLLSCRCHSNGCHVSVMHISSPRVVNGCFIAATRLLVLGLGSLSSCFLSYMGCVGVMPGLRAGCSLIGYLVFDVGLQGWYPCVGFPLHFSGYLFPLLFKRETEEGAMSVGRHVMPSWLSTPLVMGAIAYVIAPFAIWEKIPRGDNNVPFPED